LADFSKQYTERNKIKVVMLGEAKLLLLEIASFRFHRDKAMTRKGPCHCEERSDDRPSGRKRRSNLSALCLSFLSFICSIRFIRWYEPYG